MFKLYVMINLQVVLYKVIRQVTRPLFFINYEVQNLIFGIFKHNQRSYFQILETFCIT